MVTVPSPIPYPIGCKATYDFALKVEDPTKCAKATVHARDCAGNIATAVPVNLSKVTKPTIVPLPSKSLLCSATDSIVLDANGNFATYSWSSGETTKQIVVRKAGTYTVTGDDGQGCSATSDPLTITFSPATPVIAPTGPLTMCAPQDTLLDAGAGYVSYQWYKDGAALPGKTSQTYRAVASGAYTAFVTNAAGCQGTSQAVTVVVNPLPPPPVITSSNNVLTSTAAKTYQWLLNGTMIPGATSQSYTPQTGGTYTVSITDANGCSSTSAPISNAGSTLVAVPAMVLANESNHVTIPLSIITSQSLPQGITRKFTAVLRFDKTLLVPDAGSYVSAVINGDDVVVTYNGSSDSTVGILSNLPFTAALGDDSCTTVTIDTFYWSTPNITVTKRNGSFCLSGLCKQGGTRLIDPDAKVTMSAATPNPTVYSIQINYKLIEHGPTSLVVSDLLGREVLRLVDSDQEPGTYSVSADVSSLPPGTYVYSLRTPTIVKSNHLQIVR